MRKRPLRQQWLAVEALVTLLMAKWTLKFVPFETWRTRLQIAPIRRAAVPSNLQIAEIVWAVDAVSRRWARSFTCLPRALAVKVMMRRRGWNCQLEVGVARSESGAFEAHAWIEHQDQIIIGNVPNFERYVKLPLRDTTPVVDGKDAAQS